MAETAPKPRHEMTTFELEQAELKRQQEAFAKFPQWVRTVAQTVGDAHPRVRNALQGFPSEEAKTGRRDISPKN